MKGSADFLLLDSGSKYLDIVYYVLMNYTGGNVYTFLYLDIAHTVTSVPLLCRVITARKTN